MSSARDAVLPAGRRRLLRSVAAAGVVVVAGLLPGVAAADEPDGTAVVGELVQAWPESDHAATSAGHEAEGPLSWLRTESGDTVRIRTEDVTGVPAGSTVAATVGDQVTDEATAEDGYAPAVDVLDVDVVTLPETEPAPRSTAGLTNAVTVALVAPAGSTPDATVTRERVVDLVDGPVADFWSEQSNGAISVGVTAAHDWIQATVDCSKPELLWDQAAAAVGFVPGPGRHLVLYLSRGSAAVSGCSYALGEVGSSPSSGGRLYVRDLSASVIAHELGHNFGLGHSSGRQCDGGVEAGSCRTVSYRDYYDVMGVSWAQLGSLNAPHAAQLGVLPTGQQAALSVGGSPTGVTLAPLGGRTGTRALRLTDAEGVDYWLEYRTAAGRDAWLDTSDNAPGLEAGVLLRRADAFPETSVLLDGTPTTQGFWQADLQTALPVGVPVQVSGGDFTVVVEAADAAGAGIRVVPAPLTPPSAPAAPAAPPAPGTVLAGSGDAPVGSAAPVAEPAAVAFWAPEFDASGSARTRMPVLESVADASSGVGLLAPVAAVLLAGTTLLLVRRLRRASLARR